MTKQEQRDTADRIAAEHGCEIVPGQPGRPVVGVIRRYQQGGMIDRRRVRACMDAIAVAGIDTSGWLS